MIPRIIHQTWRTSEVPERYRDWQASWQRLNPGYAYRLWTNDDIERLISVDFPQWAPLFDSYAKNICRIDLARYLILKKHGGIYADLDYECLRPQDPLLRHRPLLFGAEPASHAQLEKAVRAGLDTIVCNAWIASVPGHPFWDHLLDFLKSTAGAPDVLDATGPFALTRALRHYAGKDMAVLRPEQLYPAAKAPCWDGRINDLEFFEQATREAFGIHYWEGSWFREGAAGRELRIPTIRARRSSAQAPAAAAPSAQQGSASPLVSCITVSSGKPAALRRAIADFRRQTWENAELLIVTSAAAAPLALLRAEHDDPRLRWIFAATTDDLLAQALATARGDYVALWNDGELHDPSRLQWQMKALLQTGTTACLLERCVLWQPARRRLAVSGRRAQPASLICATAALPQTAGAASVDKLAAALLERAETLLIDLPRLMVTIDSADDDGAVPPSADFSGAAYERMLRELSKRVSVDDWLQANAADSAARSSPSRSHHSAAAAAVPKVLVLTPMKNTERHLERYFALLQSLDYPPQQLSLAIMEGDSTDGTPAALQAWQSRLAGRFARFDVHQHHTGFQPGGARWRKEIQRERRSVIAEARNRLLAASLRDEDWVLWLDADLVDYPPALLQALLGAQRDIVAPLCVRPNGRVFDLNTFCFRPDRATAERAEDLVDGIYQPPPGMGRVYLDAFADRPLVELDGVGGAALLISADLHRRGLNFPSYSHQGYIETEGLAAMARDMGIACWGMPQLTIVHGDH